MGITGGSSADKLKHQIGKQLGHGEFLVASGRLRPREEAGESENAPAGRALPDKLALAVTDRRVLVLRMGGPLDRVQEVTHSIPLHSIVDVRVDADGKSVRIAIAFRDGTSASLEAARPNTKAGEELGRALTTALARR
jgi:hypothetical protein